jgi:hypothetical protein
VVGDLGAKMNGALPMCYGSFRSSHAQTLCCETVSKILVLVSPGYEHTRLLDLGPSILLISHIVQLFSSRAEGSSFKLLLVACKQSEYSCRFVPCQDDVRGNAEVLAARRRYI